MLKGEKIIKRFGGLIAVNKVDFQMSRGTVTGLIGPNGSGKTTLFNCITGIYKPEGGRIFLQGREITGNDPSAICRLGVARTFQIVRPFRSLTAKENAMVAFRFGRRPEAQPVDASRETNRILELVGLRDKENIRAKDLILADRKKLEIARALCTDPLILLLDEVASGLNQAELRDMVALLRKIHSEGITIFMVEHIMSVIMDICSHIIVLSEGKKIAEGSPVEISYNQMVIDVYLGKESQHPIAR